MVSITICNTSSTSSVELITCPIPAQRLQVTKTLFKWDQDFADTGKGIFEILLTLPLPREIVWHPASLRNCSGLLRDR